MKTALVSAFVLAALTATAAAETQTPGGAPIGKDGYVGLGVELGGQRDLKAGAMIDGGLRLSDSPLYLHARYAHGLSGDRGSYDQVRVGLEARKCSSNEWFCGFAGLDVGYQADHVVSDKFCIKGDNGGGCEGAHMETMARDFLLVPRAGVEVGKRVKWRTSVELPVAMRMDMPQTVTGLSVTTGVAYAW